MAMNPETADPNQAYVYPYHVYQDLIETALPDYLGCQDLKDGGQVGEAARYSLMNGGKRVRPILLLAVMSMLDNPIEDGLPFACAIEMIHTYSLIHDDLPCMDNDDQRRGQPTCHIKFGEDFAVLAGDHLLNRAYEILLSAISLNKPGTLEAARIIARAAGSRGMIGGQALDLSAEGQSIQLEDLEHLHRMKTGALIKAPILAAAALAQTDQATIDQLELLGEAIGLAFQIRDDILDVTASDTMLGKTAGKDERDQKATYVTLLGMEQAMVRLREATEQALTALASLEKMGYCTAFLRSLTCKLMDRNK